MFDLTPIRRGRNCRLFNVEDFFKEDFFRIDNQLMTPFFTNTLKADIKDTETSYNLVIDVPGMSKEHINLHFENDTLLIEGKREYDQEVKEDNFIRRERSYGNFRRAFYFPNIDEDQIKASFKDGILQVSLPKTEKAREPGKAIEIE